METMTKNKTNASAARPTSKIRTVEVRIQDLKPAVYNPRKASPQQFADLKAGIERFGLVDPIIANAAPARRNIVIGGHLRLRVAKELGYLDVPVVYLNIPDVAREKELNLRLNKNLGEWDWNLLAKLEREILEGAGFVWDDVLMNVDLEEADQAEVDESRFEVMTVLPPEAPVLKEHGVFRFENIQDYRKVKKFFAAEGGHLDPKKLLRLIA